MNADAKLDAPVIWYARVALDQAGLHLDRAPDRVHYAPELDDAAVASALDDATGLCHAGISLLDVGRRASQGA